MSMVTYPLNNIEYTAEDAELFHSTRTSGVYATDSFDYSVTGSDNSIVIGTGIAWIKNRQFSGKVVAQKEPMSLDMGLPDPTYPRIDAVVIQFNSNKNATEIVVKNGAASSFPIAPEVVRTESLYELHLYHVRREAGSLSISAPNITDLRNNNAYCGLMSDSITQAVDSTLSKNGVAADAAAVGNALALKATALESTDHPGCYYRTVDGVSEWYNPPMALGMEYRTTERWQGKVVYTKLVDFGELPSSTNKDVDVGVSAEKIIRSVNSIHLTNIGAFAESPYFTADATMRITHFFNSTKVRINTTGDTAATAKFQIWYVKN